MSLVEKPWPARRLRLAFLLLAVLAGALYLNTTANGFVFDDNDLVVENERIRSWSNIPTLFRAGWRPLKRLSLMVDYHLFGLDPRGFHATNIVWHVLATLSLALLVRGLGGSDLLAVVTAALFAAHPVHTEAVAVITHRKEMMATAFFLLALLGHLRLSPGFRAGAVVYGLFAASILSKEIVGATLPLAILAHDALFRPGERRQNLARSVRLLLPLVVTIALVLVVRFVYQGRASFFPFFGSRYIQEITGGALHSYPPVLATALRGFWVYLRILLFPVDLCADRDLPFSTSLADFAALIALCALLGYGYAAVRWHARAPLFCYGMLWVPLTLLPAANIVPLVPWFIAERFLYLPSVGFCLALGSALVALGRRGPGWRRLALGLGVATLVAFSMLTVTRNRVWKDDETVWRVTLGQNPRSIIARMGLLSIVHRAGDYRESVVHGRALLELDPANQLAHTNLGDALMQLDDIPAAVRALEAAVRYYPGDGLIRNNLGAGLKRLGRVDAALDEFRLAAELRPDLAEPHVNIGAHLAKAGDARGAAAAFQRAIAIDGELAVAHFNLGVVLLDLGDVDGARQHLERLRDLPSGARFLPRVAQLLEQLEPVGTGRNP